MRQQNWSRRQREADLQSHLALQLLLQYMHVCVHMRTACSELTQLLALTELDQDYYTCRQLQPNPLHHLRLSHSQQESAHQAGSQCKTYVFLRSILQGLLVVTAAAQYRNKLCLCSSSYCTQRRAFCIDFGRRAIHVQSEDLPLLSLPLCGAARA